MIIDHNGAEFEYEGITYTIGRSIVGTEQSDYKGLYGYIMEIRDGEDKETENETPDIYCTFEPPILPYDIAELGKRFSVIYQQNKTLEDIGLDEVIMATEMINGLEEPEKCHEFLAVYAVTEDWAANGERGHNETLYTDPDVRSIYSIAD